MTTDVPLIFWIATALTVFVFYELWRSTRKGGYPSAAFWVVLIVAFAIIIVELKG